jgi:hypothetical protein
MARRRAAVRCGWRLCSRVKGQVRDMVYAVCCCTCHLLLLLFLWLLSAVIAAGK